MSLKLKIAQAFLVNSLKKFCTKFEVDLTFHRKELRYFLITGMDMFKTNSTLFSFPSVEKSAENLF